MNLIQSNLYTITAAATLGIFSLSFTPPASAIAIYNAESSFSLTLENVFDSTGTILSDWSVEAKGIVVGIDLFEFEDASASGIASVVRSSPPHPWVSLSLGSMITQSATASGSATDGFAWSDVFSDLDIKVQNNSTEAMTFSFSYDIVAIAEAIGEEAYASASVDILDKNKFSYVDILAEAEADSLFGPSLDDASQSGIIEFELLGGEFNKISAWIDSTGEAEAAAVPEPAITLLFGFGLLSIPGLTRIRKMP